MNLRDKAASLKKRALDFLQDSLGCDPEYATHQHHAEPPSYQKPFGEKGTEMNENRTEEIAIPAQDLHLGAQDHPLVKCSCGEILKNCRCPESVHKQAFPNGRPAEIVQNGCEKCKTVESNPKLPPPENVAEAEFFKESDPDMRPVEKEITEHEFFKEAPEYEMRRASGRRMAYIAQKTAAKKLYHVTRTEAVPTILKNGIQPLHPSNWVKGPSDERYGEGEIFAFDNPEDAVRWAGKMDWEFNQGMGTGKISVVSFAPGKLKWKLDTADPMSQASAKGKWLKALGTVAPEQIIGSIPITIEHTRAVIKGEPVKLAALKIEDMRAIGSGQTATELAALDVPHHDEKKETEIREIARETAQYYEFGMFFDKAGSYLCKDCAYMMGENACAFVEGDISKLDGTCRYWKKEDGTTPTALERKYNKEEAGYTERPNGEGFGCHRCEYGGEAEEKDSRGRESWCSRFGMHIIPNACCAKNEGKNDIVFGPEGQIVKEANFVPLAAVTKSYGMGTPIGGTTNYPELVEDDEDAEKMASEIEAEDARIASEIEAEDRRSMIKSASLAMSLDLCSLVAASKKITFTENAGWWSKSARPTEQKLELLQKQFKLTPEQLELVIAADPSPNQTDYVAWLAKWMSKGEIRLPEDAEKIKGQLATFMKLKRSPNFTHNKDIQQYDPSKLFEVLESGATSDTPALSKKEQEQERELVTKGSKVVVQDGDLTIYKVTDAKALSLLSGGTNWCTAQENWGQRYLKDGPSYVFFEGKSAWAQFHPASSQLMNRQDVCMLEQVYGERDPYHRGWGNAYKGPKLLASFIADPTLLSALQKLAAIEPDVKAWVEKNTSNQEELLEILGEQAAKEQRENERGNYSYNYDRRTKKFSMTVRHALASGTQLSPEIEAQLGENVNTELLFKYGSKFHAGQAWEPLAKAILAQKGISKEIISYATKFVRARWPEGEVKLLKGALLKTYGASNMKLTLEYAQRVIKTRWPELEAKFHKAKPSEASGYGSAEYAISILKQRWAGLIKPRRDGKINEEEIIIIGAPAEAKRYAETFMPGQRWAEFEQSALAANHITALTDYTAEIIKARNPELEQAILNGQRDALTKRHWEQEDSALYYAEKVMKGRWPEYEQKILEFTASATDEKGGTTEFRPTLPNTNRWSRYTALPGTVKNYIEDVVKARWPEFEQTLMARYQGHFADWNTNQSWLDSYLALLDDMCRERKTKVEQNEADDESSKRKTYTEFTDDPQCYWPEGEQRLKTRDENYEAALIKELKERSISWRKDEKDGKIEYRGNFGYKETYKEEMEVVMMKVHGIWVFHYGTGELEKYTDYMASVGQNWPMGRDIVTATEEMDEMRGVRYNPPKYKKQQDLQFQSSLLKKSMTHGVHGVPHTKEPAAIKIKETPKFLPPRDDTRSHMDHREQKALRKDVMRGVKIPLNPPPPPKPDQIDPNISISAAEVAEAEPETKVETPKAQVLPRRAGNWKLYAWPEGVLQFGRFGEIKRPAPKAQTWYVGDKAKALPIVNENWGPLTHEQENQLLQYGALGLPGVDLRLTNVVFYEPVKSPVPRRLTPKASLLQKEASDAFLSSSLLKRAGEEEDAAFLEKVFEAEDEARQAFMSEPYLLQEAQDRNCAMEELWDDIGKEYANEYFASKGYREPQNWMAHR